MPGDLWTFSITLAMSPDWEATEDAPEPPGGSLRVGRGAVPQYVGSDYDIWIVRIFRERPPGGTYGKLRVVCLEPADDPPYYTQTLYRDAADDQPINVMELNEVAGGVQYKVNGAVIHTSPVAFPDFIGYGSLGWHIYVEVHGGGIAWDQDRLWDFTPPIWKVNGQIVDDGEPYTDWVFEGFYFNLPPYTEYSGWWEKPLRDWHMLANSGATGAVFWKGWEGLVPPPKPWIRPDQRGGYGRGLAVLYDIGPRNTFLLYHGPEDVRQRRGFYQTSPSALPETIFSAGTGDTSLQIVQYRGRKTGFFARGISSYAAIPDWDGIDRLGDGIADYVMTQITTWDGYCLMDVATALDGRRSYAVLDQGGTALHLSRCPAGDPALSANWTDPANNLIVTGLAGTAVARIQDYGYALRCFYQVGTAAVEVKTNYDDGTTASWA